MITIVLDPGHGGTDPGAAAFGLNEKDINLDIALRTRAALGFYEAKVYLTRDTDQDVGLGARAAVANKLGADYFLSIHVNAGGGAGFESYVHTYAGEKSRAIRDVIHARVSDFYSSAGFGDRGKKSANFAVLRLTAMPAVLLENLSIDRKEDAARLAEPSFREGLAGAIADGLARALSLRPVDAWDPVAEIEKLKADGLIVSDHEPGEKVPWGEFAAVINRYRGKSSAADPWDPGKEISKLKSDGLINSVHDPVMEVLWGEFAAVLNRLRGR